ncbi:MAG: hypothetical protein PHX18_08035 [Candidatus Gastranaerophilales bacterium]|nr:hypothetical protein [Candidatus Gastranaerophilales bacterium]
MLKQLFSLLGFSSTENYVGLFQLKEGEVKELQPVEIKVNKEIKLSDLMKGSVD